MRSLRSGAVREQYRRLDRMTAGLGVEYAFTDNVAGRLEYRYTSVGTSGFMNAATNSAVGPERLPISDLRVGVAYKFGCCSATAKY